MCEKDILTSKSITDNLIYEIISSIKEINQLPHSKSKSLELLAFDILNIIDGCHLKESLPAFDLLATTKEGEQISLLEFAENEVSLGLADYFTQRYG